MNGKDKLKPFEEDLEFILKEAKFLPRGEKRVMLEGSVTNKPTLESPGQVLSAAADFLNIKERALPIYKKIIKDVLSEEARGRQPIGDLEVILLAKTPAMIVQGAVGLSQRMLDSDQNMRALASLLRLARIENIIIGWEDFFNELPANIEYMKEVKTIRDDYNLKVYGIRPAVPRRGGGGGGGKKRKFEISKANLEWSK